VVLGDVDGTHNFAVLCANAKDVLAAAEEKRGARIVRRGDAWSPVDEAHDGGLTR